MKRLQSIIVLTLLVLSQYDVAAQNNKSGNAGTTSSGFTASSAAFENNGNYPKLYTCDSTGIAPTLQWSGAPKETTHYAVTMHHIAKDGEKHVYIVLYDIPSSTTMLPNGMNGIGKWGFNTVNRQTQYAPPCSKGPGPKNYIITVYALSAAPVITVPQSQVSMGVLLDAIKNITLSRSAINVTYSRPF
jgi:phosphatidylethanolamine-binding protein (PEBP) family uncharacterized protein